MNANPLSVVSEQAALEHILRHHAGADGWITLSRKESNGQFKQEHHRIDDITAAIAAWVSGDTTDIYFSQNTFYKRSRKIENIRQLRALYVDMDCYLFNHDPAWVIGNLEIDFFSTRVPEPNFVIFSGRGLVLVWLLEPVPSQALPLWQAVENHFVAELKKFGGDSKASDAARVLRLAGTLNSKSLEPVHVHYRHNARYILRELQEEYLPPIKPKKSTKQRTIQPRVYRAFNEYSLNHGRLHDILKLCELREWVMNGHRETTLFLYRYWACCFLNDPVEALEQTRDINRQFTEPLPDKEVVKCTKSAEKAWRAKNSETANRMARENGYPGAGYYLTNAKLIEWLGITEEEQSHLKTIIGRRVKLKRNNLRRSEARRKVGKMTREEYLGEAEKRRQEAMRMRREGMSYRKIAEAMSTSVSQVQRMLKHTE